jgi:hypothetical protein
MLLRNVTDVPAHITLPGLADTLFVGTTVGVTVIVMLLLVTVAGIAQPLLLVIVQVTTSPFASDVLV